MTNSDYALSASMRHCACINYSLAFGRLRLIFREPWVAFATLPIDGYLVDLPE